jgi:predicted MFS family arabinose efflux permease
MCGLAVNFFTLLIARMGVGIFEAGSAPPSHSLISDYFPPEERASALGIFTSGINVGVIISLVVGGWVNQYFGWRAAFFVVGIPGVIMALVVWFSVREPGRGVFDRAKPPMNTNTFQVIRHLLSIPSFRHACLADGFYSIVMYVLLIWGPVYLIRIHGYETGVLGTWLALIIGIGGFIGTLIGGFTADALVKKTGDKAMVLKLCTASTIIATPFFVMFGLSSSPVMALMLLGIGWLVGNLWLGPVYSVIQSLSDASSRAVAVAIALFAVNMIGYGLGPLMVGIVSDALNPAYGDEAIRYALLLVIILAGFAGTIHFFLASRSYVQDLEKKYEEELI